MRPKLIALIAVSAVALVGCAGIESSGQPAESPVESPAAQALVMSSEEADESSVAVDPTDVVLTDEQAAEAFIGLMEPKFSGWTGELPVESALLAAGKISCKQLDAGVDYYDVEAIEGSTSLKGTDRGELSPEQLSKADSAPLYLNNMRIVNAARSALCMDHLK